MQRTKRDQPSAIRTQSKTNQPSSSKTAMDTTKPADKSKTATKEKKTIEFQLPALSIVGKKKEIDYEQIRKKIIRRGNPDGEDKKQLANILKHLKDSKAKIKVFEFVNLISKYTCDNGEVMRKVMEEDLASFRKMVTKVYENMTQDVSDVLVNEQIQTANFYQERYDMFNNKMLWMINEIFQMIPEFDMERYGRDKQDFLDVICPIPVLIRRDAEDIDLQKRQEAFHRLQWLKIEEDRLSEENRRLEARLDELKNLHNRETTEATMKSMIMEQRMQDLADEEQEKQDHLSELEGILGKNIVRAEAYVRLEEDETIRLTKPLSRDVKKKETIRSQKKSGKSDDWPVRTAVTMEERAAREAVEAESARADEKKRMRRREREPGKETTLFGEPPPKAYPDFPSASRMRETNVEQTTTTIQEKRRRVSRGKCGGGCS